METNIIQYILIVFNRFRLADEESKELTGYLGEVGGFLLEDINIFILSLLKIGLFKVIKKSD